jgi:hypothetical protein
LVYPLETARSRKKPDTSYRIDVSKEELPFRKVVDRANCYNKNQLHEKQ